MVQLFNPYTTTGKTIALTRCTFVGKVRSLLFIILSRFVIAFLPRSKCFIISWLQPPSAVILEPKNIKSVSVSTFSPLIFHGARYHEFIFWTVSFQTSFFTLLFHFYQEALQFLFTFCHKGVSSAYLRLLIFLPAILIPACASSSPAFLMMYSASKLNKQGDNIQPDVLLSRFGTSLLFHVQF